MIDIPALKKGDQLVLLVKNQEVLEPEIVKRVEVVNLVSEAKRSPPRRAVVKDSTGTYHLTSKTLYRTRIRWTVLEVVVKMRQRM